VLGVFSNEAFGIATPCAHQERPGWKGHHFRARWAVPKRDKMLGIVAVAMNLLAASNSRRKTKSQDDN
jgi:hypothetical protein